MGWKKYNGNPIISSLEDEVEATLVKELAEGNEMKICIGTDSQVKSQATEFASVIVFIRKQKGGFMFVNKFKEIRKMGLKERMILEVGKSVEIAYSLSSIVEKYQVELEIHADINTDPNFPSYQALKEAMGYILGMGYKFKAKPDAFASSQCADKLV
jgi:predicted RNase H-related nuclease YkuK (DUF458 family)